MRRVKGRYRKHAMGLVAKRIATLTPLLMPQLLAPAVAQTNDASFDCVIEAQQLVKLASPIVGIVARLAVDRGDVVRKGQVLGNLEDAIDRANLALARVKATNDFPVTSLQARLNFLQRKYGRAEQLVARSAGSQANLDEANADAKVAEQQLKEAQLNLNLAKLELEHSQAVLEQKTLRSPIDGLVVERLLLPGEYRNEQSAILTLAQIDPLRVEVFVPTRYYRQIRVGSMAVVRPEEPIGGSYSASVAVVDRVMDAASGTFGVRLALSNPDLTLPAGIRCRIKFELDSASIKN